MTTAPVLAGQLRYTDREWARGEAAVWVASHAAERGLTAGEARQLVDVLGLEDACYKWDVARVVCVVLEHCKLGRQFTSCTLYSWVPPRARPLIARAMQWLRKEGMAEHTGEVVPSQAPGAKGRKVPVWRLTYAGEQLARNVAPIPGMTPFLAEIF